MTYTENSLTGTIFIDGVCVKEPDTIFDVVDDKGFSSVVVVPFGTKVDDLTSVITEKLSKAEMLSIQ